MVSQHGVRQVRINLSDELEEAFHFGNCAQVLDFLTDDRDPVLMKLIHGVDLMAKLFTHGFAFFTNSRVVCLEGGHMELQAVVLLFQIAGR